MEWRGRRESQNVEDRRGSRSPLGRGGFGIPIGRMGRRGGGLSLGGILALLAISWIFGINPLALLDGGGVYPTQQTSSDPRPGSSTQDELSRFVRVVLADTEDTWNGIFAQANHDYPEPTLVLFTDTAQSACGYASSASGPFYCPGDRRLYIDLSFYEELRRRFQAPGDFAQAYVIAHEVGHHVQNLIGSLGQQERSRSNETSIRIELQADCFAGIWGRDAADKGFLEAGDFDEAMNAAAQVGDDAIQRRTQGRVVPESFNHGTSEQRKRWFKRGFDTKSVKACDTFAANPL
jgi:predicted metalloprotease